MNPPDNINNEKKEQREFEYLFRLFELYTNVQVQADTIYHNRTSIITLAEGLLLVAYQSLAQNGQSKTEILGIWIATIGFILSILWLFFEQRNAIYFKGRGSVLEGLEITLLHRRVEAKAAFSPFWIEVPHWVKKNAAWYQRMSAPLILRFFVPALFIISWLVILITTPTIFNENNSNTLNIECSLKQQGNNVSQQNSKKKYSNENMNIGSEQKCATSNQK